MSERAPVPFDPARRLSRVNGAEYLEVRWRLAWFRERYPDGQIETQMLDRGPGWVIFRATVVAIGEGGVLCGSATGHSHGAEEAFRDYIEKAETAALGRALGALGFGTQFVVNHEGSAARHGRPVEAPVPLRTATPAPRASGTPPPPPPDQSAGEAMTARQRRYLESVAHAAGLDPRALDELAERRCGAAYQALSRSDASALITELEQRE